MIPKVETDRLILRVIYTEILTNLLLAIVGHYCIILIFFRKTRTICLYCIYNWYCAYI